MWAKSGSPLWVLEDFPTPARHCPPRVSHLQPRSRPSLRLGRPTHRSPPAPGALAPEGLTTWPGSVRGSLLGLGRQGAWLCTVPAVSWSGHVAPRPHSAWGLSHELWVADSVPHMGALHPT